MKVPQTKMSIKRSVSPRRQANQRGNALIEFGLCAIFLIMITIGITDFSRSLAVADVAASAAAAGAQYGALSPAHWSDFTGITNAANNDTGNIAGVTVTPSNTCYCNLGGIATTCPASCGGGSQIEYVTVSVSVPATSYFNFPWMPTFTSLSAIESVRVE